MMPDPMSFRTLDEMRCRCADSELELVEGLPMCLRCKTCRGWFGLQLAQMTNLDLLRQEFGEPKL